MKYNIIKFASASILALALSACGGINEVKVTATAGANGKVAPAERMVKRGRAASFKITPDTNYTIDKVSGCKGTLKGTTYTTGKIKKSCTVKASFKPISHKVTTTAGENGKIVPTTRLVNQSNLTTFSLVPNSGFTIDKVSGCAGTLSGTTYTTGKISGACAVSASFRPITQAPITHKVTASAGANGQITPAERTVNQGGTTTFTVTADSNYTIDKVSGCAGTLSGTTYTTGKISGACAVSASFRPITHKVTASAGANGQITPAERTVNQGSTTTFTVTADSNYTIDKVSGCAGTLSGTTYTTGKISGACAVSASFRPITHKVTASAGANGQITPAERTVNQGSTTTFTVTADSNYTIDEVSGCAGTLSGTTYTTGKISGACAVSASFRLRPPATAAVPTLSFTQVKGFTFTWQDVSDASYYQLLENPDGQSGSTQVGDDIPRGQETITLSVPLYKRINAHYILQSCNAGGCVSAEQVNVSGTLVDSIGYFKASNTGVSKTRGVKDQFGVSVSLSGDGNTLAVGAHGEGSNATGVDGDQTDNSAHFAGAVYVFTRSGTSWAQQAYVKASNTGVGDRFGISVSLSSDGNTLAVGAYGEASSATGVDGDQTDNSAGFAGAVYVFTRSGTSWAQQAYVKASNTGVGDRFGFSVGLSGDGNTLAIGAFGEGSSATGVDGGQTNNTARSSGAVYVFTRSGTAWTQQAYVKASNTGGDDRFGSSVSLSGDGNTLAVGAGVFGEDSNATGVDGDQTNNDAPDSGAVYVFTRSGTTWAQQAYVKASNTGEGDQFGGAVAVSLSSDGNTLAVGAYGEASSATGVGGDQTNNDATSSGAVYVFTRSGTSWAQQAYVKASNTGVGDRFGFSVGLSGDGNTLAVGAYGEASSATGVDGDQTNNSAGSAGAVYVFTRSGTTWTQRAYIKASNTDSNDFFGGSVSLSSDGNTLAVGAAREDSIAKGVNGDQTDNSAVDAGAVYVY